MYNESIMFDVGTSTTTFYNDQFHRRVYTQPTDYMAASKSPRCLCVVSRTAVDRLIELDPGSSTSSRTRHVGAPCFSLGPYKAPAKSVIPCGGYSIPPQPGQLSTPHRWLACRGHHIGRTQTTEITRTHAARGREGKSGRDGKSSLQQKVGVTDPPPSRFSYPP